MRRRLREQLRVREALLLDLGALVYELHRQGKRAPELLQQKAAELTVVDEEVRELQAALEGREEAAGETTEVEAVEPEDEGALDEDHGEEDSFDEEPGEEDSLDEEPEEGQALDEEPEEGQALDEEPAEGHALDEEPAEGHALDDEPPVEDEPRAEDETGEADEIEPEDEPTLAEHEEPRA
jgi:hypothetical protein